MKTDINAMVRMEQMSKIFNPNSVNEVVLFNDFNLSISNGDFVSLVGSNGSGKTTLLNLLCGSIPVDSGNFFVKDREITGLKEFERSGFIGRVFQDPAKGTCSEMTILENMAMADHKGKPFLLTLGINKKRVDYFKSQLQLLKLGLEDKINLKVGTLSGGQRQALALLISTMTPIDLLILDEHTAALDPKSSENVMKLTEKILEEKKITTLMVTHNLRFAIEYGNRLIMMHRGSVVLDTVGKKRKALKISDLTQKFNEISIEDGH